MTRKDDRMSAEAYPAQARPNVQAALRPVDFVKKVGKGKTLSQHLSHAESSDAFTALLDGAFTSAQAGAFLQALRINELAQEELDALAGVFRDRTAAQPPLAGAKTLVLNLASDTGRKGGLASLLAAHLLGRFGVGVGLVRSAPVLSGNVASFDTTWELSQSLDAAAFAPTASAATASATAVVPPPPAPILADCSTLVKGLAAMDKLRGELGFRSCLHTAEKLVNPWKDSPVLLGISHKHYALRMAGTMAALGFRGRILLGNHGTVDLVLHKETDMVVVEGGVIREESVSPAQLGLELSSDVYALGKFPQWRGWLDAGDKALLRAVQYHVAVFLWAAGSVPDAAAGLAAAKTALPGLF
jgi:anthranilate phosphoribosyltransferase